MTFLYVLFHVPWERTVGFITALTYSARCTIQLETVQNVGPPPQKKKRYFKWADERVRNTQCLKSLNAKLETFSSHSLGAQKTGDEVQGQLRVERHMHAQHTWGWALALVGPLGKSSCLERWFCMGGKCRYTYMCSPATHSKLSHSWVSA